MKTRTLVIIALLQLGISSVYAKLGETEARRALEEQIQTMQFQVAPGAPAMINLSGLGGAPNQLKEVKWLKTYKETLENEIWTVFVADAVVDTYHGEYKIHAGIGLQEKGDDVVMCQAFEPLITRVEPTPDEQLAEKKAEARQSRMEEALTKTLRSKWNGQVRDLGDGLHFTIGFYPENLPGGSNEMYGRPILFKFLHKNGVDAQMSTQRAGKPEVAVFIGRDADEDFPLSATQEDLANIADFLGKFVSWSKTAKEKQVTSVNKNIGEIEQVGENMKPGALFVFQVDDSGEPALVLSAASDTGGRSCKLNVSQAERFRETILSLPREISHLVEQAFAEADKDLASDRAKDSLFK